MKIELSEEELETITAQVLARLEKKNTAGSLTIDAAAERLNVSRRTVERRIEAGLIITIPGLRSRISTVEIDRLLGKTLQ